MDEELNQQRQRGLYRRRRCLRSGQGPRVMLGGREYVNFSSNDYLNLASDQRLARAAARAARRFGTGAGASPLVSGFQTPLRVLEHALAEWEGTEAALVFSSGFVANLALVSSVAGRGDALFSDALNHASLIDGCRLSRARVHVFRHRDVNQLEDLLKSERAARRRIIVSDTVFSMDGDRAPLAELFDLARRHDALLLLDEAHATGVLGANGRGAVEETPPPAGFDPAALLRVGTLSKALGAQGGFVAGSRRLVSWLVNVARPYIFSTALAPPLAAAARTAVGIVQAEPERRAALRALASRFGTSVPIIAQVVGDPRQALRLSRRLRERGLLVPAIRPPSVPEGTARLRISLTAGHTAEDVARLQAALAEEGAAIAPLPCP